MQAIRRGDPDASIRGGLHCPGTGGETLLGCNRRESIGTEPVEPAHRVHPDVAFSIFEHAHDVLVGKTILDAEDVRPASPNVHQTVEGGYPQAAIARATEANGPRH